MNAILYPITADKLENAKKMEEKYAKNKFPVFYDDQKKVVKLLNQEVIITKLGRMPALLIVDKKGIIRYAYFGNSMSDIPKNNELFKELEKLQN